MKRQEISKHSSRSDGGGGGVSPRGITARGKTKVFFNRIVPAQLNGRRGAELCVGVTGRQGWGGGEGEMARRRRKK